VKVRIPREFPQIIRVLLQKILQLLYGGKLSGCGSHVYRMPIDLYLEDSLTLLVLVDGL
jgi:hypothetical protein